LLDFFVSYAANVLSIDQHVKHDAPPEIEGIQTMQQPGRRIADPTRLQRFASLALQRVGVPPADADLSAEILVDTDLRGIDTHGVMNLPSAYVQRLKAGLINARPNIELRRGSATTAVIDGDNGLGFVVAHRSMREAISMAEEHGSGWTSVCNSNHSGAGTYYVLMAARQGMVGIHFSSGGSTVGAPGGKGKLLGNNVIAMAAPAGRYAPFVFDMAPTMTVANRARMLEWDGLPMPEGWVIDTSGQPVIDPREYFDAGSSVLPLGGSVAQGAHKGFGLLLMADIFAGMLSGDGGSMIRARGAETHAFAALRIDAFTSAENFHGLMEAMIDKIHAAPTLDGMPRLRYPGERADQDYQAARTRGILLHPVLAQELTQMGEELGVPFAPVYRE
jgi:L-2-hydroxycarboxylate dehydrogenase (NAD+)